MNKTELETIKEVLNKTAEKLNTVLVESDRLLLKEKELDKRDSILIQMANDIKSREEALVKERDLLDKHIKQYDEDKMTLAKQEANFNEQKLRFDTTKQDIKKREDAISDKLKTLELLTKREETILAKEKLLEEKDKSLIHRENVLTKELELSRDRKKSLDIIEEDLKRKQIKVQKFLEI